MTITAGRKLTAKDLKELAAIQPAVAAQVKHLRDLRRTRRIAFRACPAGYRHPLGEGERLTFYASDGKTLHTNIVTESTVGCASDGLNYHVGKQTPPLPEGTWIVSEELFLGQWYIRVCYVGPDESALRFALAS